MNKLQQEKRTSSIRRSTVSSLLAGITPEEEVEAMVAISQQKTKEVDERQQIHELYSRQNRGERKLAESRSFYFSQLLLVLHQNREILRSAESLPRAKVTGAGKPFPDEQLESTVFPHQFDSHCKNFRWNHVGDCIKARVFEAT